MLAGVSAAQLKAAMAEAKRYSSARLECAHRCLNPGHKVSRFVYYAFAMDGLAQSPVSETEFAADVLFRVSRVVSRLDDVGAYRFTLGLLGDAGVAILPFFTADLAGLAAESTRVAQR